jgi:hypothetical protein
MFRYSPCGIQTTRPNPKSVVVKTEIKKTVEERPMTAEQTTGDDDNVDDKVEKSHGNELGSTRPTG